MRSFASVIFMLLLAGVTNALAMPADSVEAVKKVKPYTTTIIARFHTAGYFSYTGRLISDYPAVDIFFNYNRPSWGFQVFKAVDLKDHNTQNNFTFALAYKTFHVGKKLTVQTYVGGAMDQSHSFADKGSDFVFLLTTTYKLNQYFTIDHSAMFTNLVLEKSETDWVNRFRLMYSNKHFDATWLAWHNNGLINPDHYTSTAVSVFYNRMQVAKRLFLGAGITGLCMIDTSDREAYPKKSGVLFSLTATVH